ncbi:unnamed protein product [Didymodactylos carnosus]|uniref:Uncharacterized protein n=1 Tax=Didymodactylos carnosus TaxID=1234261 RepID=A0A814BVI8_9BILA|nr:unnamed protein product [Didymodactylos carnosus]CAF1063573.1 unnamed protein product [Didymodactylos carnosus]CAF3712635.1 unnamed protein product [Didymodactylos carnosus]CAF3828843.1 unnamed protein product [Didymodactylos carnosus]
MCDTRIPRPQKSIPKRVYGAITAPFRSSKEDKSNSEPNNKLIEQYLHRIRHEIISEGRNLKKKYVVDQDDHLYLQASKLMNKVIQSIVDVTRGTNPNETRQVRTDLIQKIVGLINTLIKDVNLELRPCCLSLNKPLKSIFHTCTVVLLTKYYYNEQQNHFLQQISTLSDKKDDLRLYFINMVVPNTIDDFKCAVSLCKHVREYAMKSLSDEGQKSINSGLRQYENLNRKWIQDCCDGKLFTAETQWHLDYIENPTKIIEEFF